MRAPNPPGSAIDARRFRTWVQRFSSYRDSVTNLSIETWLELFDKSDRDLAARVLDAVDYYPHSQIAGTFRQMLGALPGWSLDQASRVGNWRFVAMSGSAGESGDAMLYQFRVANGLDSKRYNNLFPSRSDLFRQAMLPEEDPNRIGADDTVVFIDDFSGTGQQVCEAWNDPVTSFGALLAGVGKVYLILVAASQAARDRIQRETSLSLFPAVQLTDRDNVFSEGCSHFSDRDKARLLHYGRRADPRNPRGRGDCGFVVIFQHRSPNNTIPILHACNARWMGLFPRHD